MELNSIINNDDLSLKMKDIYKFIDKNTDKIDDIFNRTYNDIKNLFPNVYLTEDSIDINNIDINTLMTDRNKCHSILLHHAKDVLEDNSYLLPYAFKINMLKDSIEIVRKH